MTEFRIEIDRAKAVLVLAGIGLAFGFLWLIPTYTSEFPFYRVDPAVAAESLWLVTALMSLCVLPFILRFALRLMNRDAAVLQVKDGRASSLYFKPFGVEEIDRIVVRQSQPGIWWMAPKVTFILRQGRRRAISTGLARPADRTRLESLLETLGPVEHV